MRPRTGRRRHEAAPVPVPASDLPRQALDALASLGDEAKPLAGGQSLMPMLNFRLARPGVLVDLGRIAGLDALTVGDDSCDRRDGAPTDAGAGPGYRVPAAPDARRTAARGPYPDPDTGHHRRVARPRGCRCGAPGTRCRARCERGGQERARLAHGPCGGAVPGPMDHLSRGRRAADTGPHPARWERAVVHELDGAVATSRWLGIIGARRTSTPHDHGIRLVGFGVGWTPLHSVC